MTTRSYKSGAQKRRIRKLFRMLDKGLDELRELLPQCVSPNDGLPIECLLIFLEIDNHKGKSIVKMVHLTNESQIDFSKCRGQSRDNVANMSGKYKGMQEMILKINAMDIPCAGYSLDLIGRAAVDVCLDTVNFFGIFQGMYNFLSSSLLFIQQYCCHSLKMIQSSNVFVKD
ncbi:zinc finger MYM-type protein 1 [Caerostris extrusa]|uniref:Zinc finger MYM-type protein 1 n=1 Tax=Caerostris extrusa TaxID=172846 RepID=A0AAV4NDU0_CAEEX|nr:zinc finger MYM-type protein 1 [Caerostris extrusa]